ncbi:hypothetical protein MMC17_006639 [Xylographa soralifera]|nr:hypothetical protein [Xylographa soralifera]
MEAKQKLSPVLAPKRGSETSQAENNAPSLVPIYVPESKIEKHLAKRVNMLDVLVTIIVGPEEKSYAIHKGLLCMYSQYIKAALSNDCIESKALAFRLDEETPKTFDHFVNWLYSQRVVPKGESLEEMTWMSLVQLYVLADRRTCTALKNDVMDSLVTKVVKGNETINCDSIVYIWKNTPSLSKLRLFAVDCQAYCGQLVEFANGVGNREELPLDYVFDLLAKYYQLTEKKCNLMKDFEKLGFSKAYHEVVKDSDC